MSGFTAQTIATAILRDFFLNVKAKVSSGPAKGGT
jgi:hypothetical protein